METVHQLAELDGESIHLVEQVLKDADLSSRRHHQQVELIVLLGGEDTPEILLKGPDG